MTLGPASMSGNATLVTPAVPVPLCPSVDPANCSVPFEDSRVFVVTLYCAVCALGLPANCLTGWLALGRALRGNVLAVYLSGLALCEALYASTLPLWALYVQNQHCWTLGPWACKVTAYVFFCNLYVSVLLLCCVSCDRFVAVVYALESRGHRRQKTAILVCASAFLLVGLVHYPVFDMEHRDTCFETVPMDGRTARYYYARFAAGFAVPLSIIAFTNQRVLRSVEMSEGLSAASKARVRRTATAVVGIFLLCFAPYHVLLLVKAAAFSYYRGDKFFVCDFEVRVCTVSVVSLCLSTVSSVADPIIYVLATDHSRQEVSRIHREWKKWRAKTNVTKVTSFKDSEEACSPTSLANGYMFPRPIQPPGPQPDTWASLCSLERLGEESC